MLSLVENLFLQKNPFQDFLSCLNFVEFITGHVIYNQAYTYKFQLKTTIIKYCPAESSQYHPLFLKLDTFTEISRSRWPNGLIK